MNRILHYINLVLVYAVALAFSIKNLLEPDLWWQLRTGEWILDTGTVPHFDTFSFTYAGTPWQNLKWGFEYLIALLSELGGVEMIMGVQLVCSVLLVYFLIRLTKALLGDQLQPIMYLLIGLSFIALEYRITGRPETITHTFFVAFITLLLEFRKKPSVHIWWVPLLMMCWANLHEAFGIGFVILGVFTASSWFESIKLQTQTKEQSVKLLLVMGASVLSVCINPIHINILLKPYEIATQVYENKFTSEFNTYLQPTYWTKEAWISLSLLVWCLLGLLALVVKTKGMSLFKRVAQIIPLPFLIMVLLMVYLATSGHRNIVFATLLLVPFSNTILKGVAGALLTKLKSGWIQGLSIVVLILLYVGIVSNQYYTITQSRHRFGLEVPAYATPIGAARFLEAKVLLKKPILSDYLTSSYLMWSLQPNFKTFIDLRDLDVFPLEHFSLVAQMMVDPNVFEKVDSQYHFGSAVLLRAPQMLTLHKYLYTHPQYRLAYLDGVCCVYVKDSILSSVEDFEPLALQEPSAMALGITKLFNPLFEPGSIGELDQAISAAEYFADVQAFERSAFYAHQSIQNGKEIYRGYELLGQLAYQQLQMDTLNKTQMWSDSAAYCFQKAYKLNPKYVPVLIDLGVGAFNNGQYKGAVKYLEQACKLEPNNLRAQTNMAEVYKTMALNNNQDVQYLELAIQHYLKADKLNPNNPQLMMNLGFLYFRQGKCDKAVFYLEQIATYPGITELQRTRAVECIKQCR